MARDRPEDAHVITAGRRLTLIRVLIAGLLAGFVSGALWLASPRGLPHHLDIVGYATFWNYDYNPPFIAYRLVVWVWPVAFLMFLWGLRRVGPLAVEETSPDDETSLEERLDGRDLSESPAPGFVSRGLRLLVPAAVTAVGVSSLSRADDATVDTRGLAAGSVCIVMTLAVALTWARMRPRVTGSFAERMSVVNAYVASVAAVGSVFAFSQGTLVTDSSGGTDRWPFFPAWLAAIVLLAIVLMLTWRLRLASAAAVEFDVLAVISGAALVFLLVARIASPVTTFAGFDDAQSVVGADLLSRGYFPWRDFMFIHGLFEDGLRSLAGFAMFGHSMWGANAATQLIWLPLAWVGVYLVVVWSSRMRGVTIFLAVLVIGWLGYLWGGGGPVFGRWVAAPYVLALFGIAVRRAHVGWTVLLTLALFVNAVLVPESSYLVIAVLLTLIVHDAFDHRARVGRARWYAWRRALTFVASGAALSMLWGAFLLIHHSLSAFVDYYRIFGPGHNAAGAVPLESATQPYRIAFLAMTVVVALSLVGVVARIIRRSPMYSRHWVLLAAALMAGLYGEKALGRFDDPHIVQTLFVGLPAFFVALAILVDPLDEQVRQALVHLRWPMLRDGNRRHAHSVSWVLLFAFVALVPSAFNIGWHAPAANKLTVPSLKKTALIGYTSPPGIDATLVADLEQVLGRLAGKRPVFDFTNSPGYVYYLLRRGLPTSFPHVSMLVPEFAQESAIKQLRRTRPPVVLFNSKATGLSSWDGPQNQVRHFELSEYLLSGWRPVAESHGFIFLLRNDLVASMPSLEGLGSAVSTQDLYASSPACDWGDSANFLRTQMTGSRTTLTFGARRRLRQVMTHGWVVDAHGTPANRIVLAVGHRVISFQAPNAVRPDVAAALNTPTAARSGWNIALTTRRAGRLAIYAVMADGVAHPIGPRRPGVPRFLSAPGGHRLRVSSSPSRGWVDSLDVASVTVSSAQLPPSFDPGRLTVAEFRAARSLGRATVQLTGDVSAGDAGSIRFSVLPFSGAAISVRVGSCLQWHGLKRDQTLFLVQKGGRPIDQVRLGRTG